MAFVDKISKHPLPYQAERGADVAALFDGAAPAFLDLIRGTAGCSPYLAGLLQREAHWVRGLMERDADAMLAETLDTIETLPLAELKPGFRGVKRRIALLSALADLSGVWALEQVTGALTALSDRCLDHGLRLLVGQAISRGKLPGLDPDDASTAGGMCILAMGKTGAGELNYSSDIDLICLFDETRFNPDDYAEARTGFVKITRELTAIMSEVTSDGYVFRTDLRLRPDASVTPVCIAMEAAERYYEGVGRTWERAAFIKARACAGDVAAGEAFLDRLTPFVWRKHLDFAAIEDAHDMRLQIRGHKGLREEIVLEGHHLKLGVGGIREIEFFTQTRQIIAGGRDPSLRVRGTVEGLARLAEAGWVPPEVAQNLSAIYRSHREFEHRLQMVGDAQTHTLPESAEDFDRLARFVGEPNTDRMRAGLHERLLAVAEQTETFFAPDEVPEDEEGRDTAADYLEKWATLPALRSERAVAIFKRLFPGILVRLESSARPKEAVDAFERFLAGLPSGVQLFSLFEANPLLIELITDICAISPDLAEYLARHSGVLDAVIGGDFFAGWPGQAALATELNEIVGQAEDYEAKLDAARVWQKEWHFRVGVHHVRDLITPSLAARQYAELAHAVVEVLRRVTTEEFAKKHGAPPGRGAAVLAMGSLGAGRLTARSDLDLIVIYDAQGEDVSKGPKPLLTRTYFARLTQALITALSAPMAKGRLYEVDMRLRPSGQSGPVAVSIESFNSYHREDAWVWEHLALTQARPIAGDPDLCEAIETVRCNVLAAEKDEKHIRAETQDMRRRLSDAEGAGLHDNIKIGAGGRRDIALLAQALGLLSGSEARDIGAQLQGTVGTGWLSEEEAADLVEINVLYQVLVQNIALLSSRNEPLHELGLGAQRMVLRDAGFDSVAELTARLEECRKTTAKLIDLILTRPFERDMAL